MSKEGDNDICAKCGKPRIDHCKFELVVFPKGCKCSPEDWWSVRNIPPVCEKFDQMDNAYPLCWHCRHLKECHEK